MPGVVNVSVSAWERLHAEHVRVEWLGALDPESRVCECVCQLGLSVSVMYGWNVGNCVTLSHICDIFDSLTPSVACEISFQKNPWANICFHNQENYRETRDERHMWNICLEIPCSFVSDWVIYGLLQRQKT